MTNPTTERAALSGADTVAIRGVVEAFVTAWNHHDAAAFGNVFAADADFTNIRGQGASGRNAIMAFHARVFATRFSHSIQTVTAVHIRAVRPDVAAVDVNWHLAGHTDDAGATLPPWDGLLNFTIVKNPACGWQILVMHNLLLRPPP